MKKFFAMMALSAILFTSCDSDKKDDKEDDDKIENGTEGKAEKNKATALASVMGVNAHDAEAMLKDVTTDAMDYGDGSMPPVKGVDSIKAGINAWLAAFPDVKGENFMVMTDDGTHVAVFADWSGTFKNDFMGMKATGRSYKLKDADIFTFNEEGKITEHRSIQSNMVMGSQVGMEPPK
jgi:predicted ester cyclase